MQVRTASELAARSSYDPGNPAFARGPVQRWHQLGPQASTGQRLGASRRRRGPQTPLRSAAQLLKCIFLRVGSGLGSGLGHELFYRTFKDPESDDDTSPTSTLPRFDAGHLGATSLCVVPHSSTRNVQACVCRSLNSRGASSATLWGATYRVCLHVSCAMGCGRREPIRVMQYSGPGRTFCVFLWQGIPRDVLAAARAEVARQRSEELRSQRGGRAWRNGHLVSPQS